MKDGLMNTRSYRLGRRGEAAKETRQRIVKATFALHGEQGVIATSMKQIAERAGVSVGTVYHHFPSYQDAIQACGEYAFALAPPPDPAMMAGVETLPERIERLTAEVFGYYGRMPALARVRCDQDREPLIKGFVRMEEENRGSLVRAALGTPAVAEHRVQAIAAILDIAVYQAMTRAGFTAAKAAAEIARIVLASLGEAESDAAGGA